jgi:hypothetical protein
LHVYFSTVGKDVIAVVVAVRRPETQSTSGTGANVGAAIRCIDGSLVSVRYVESAKSVKEAERLSGFQLETHRDGLKEYKVTTST